MNSTTLLPLLAEIGSNPTHRGWWVGLTLAAALLVWVLWATQNRPAGMSRRYFVFSGALWRIGRLLHRLEVRGEFDLPNEGGAIVVANHTCGADPPYLIATIPRPVSFVVAAEVYRISWIKPFAKALRCVPVTRTGVDTSSLKTAMRLLKERRVVAIFPEGAIHTENFLDEGKPGTALLATKCDVPIVPLYFHGTPPHRVLWKPLFIRARITAFVGEPFTVHDLKEQGLKGRDLLKPATERIMERLRALRDRAEAELGPNPYVVSATAEKPQSLGRKTV